MARISRRTDTESSGQQYYDYNLLAVMILLTGFGLVMLYSVSSYTAQLKWGNDMYFFSRQAVISAAGLIIAIGISHIDYHLLWKLGAIIYITSFVLIALVVTPLGKEYNHARRWLEIGPFSFQPSEFAKIAVIICVPILIIKIGRNFTGWKAPLVPFGAGFLLALETYVLTSNLSTAIIILAITCILIFIVHPKTAPFVIALLVLAAVVFAVVMIIKHNMTGSSRFRLRRIMVWLDPETYSKDGGWQIMQALYALGSGGLFGKGLGNSAQKLGFVPEAENDMILSIICEELGVFGGILVIILFGYMLYRLFFIAQNAKDLFGSLLTAGVFAHIMLQVVLNIRVVLNLIPTTGITLPFISYGGTSIVFLMAEMALALSVARQIPFMEEETDLWGDVRDNYEY